MDTGVIKETESSPPETSTKRRSIRNWTIALLASLLVALIAPLLGLVGTISSMIGTFQSLEQSGTADPEVFAGNISLALTTTAGGLFVSAIGVVAFLVSLIGLISTHQSSSQKSERSAVPT